MKVPVLKVLFSLMAVTATTLVAFADDYQCASDNGCSAFQSTEGGTRRVRFKKGDIISTSNGWIVNPADGWSKVD